ncbi:hypothetical protein Vadar_001960 [Vaccinium darrowii]|uniref:Uncharacterized protein n=1 Tax=Vaccinium darrowii TaxID=229202 RepID=A0ACB7YS44_9ERIC|nr:hypothetical protein Vadar_001960 [Vaccinium darrowii]
MAGNHSRFSRCHGFEDWFTLLPFFSETHSDPPSPPHGSAVRRSVRITAAGHDSGCRLRDLPVNLPSSRSTGMTITGHHRPQFNPWKREMHSRNKKAMELIAKGWSALKEVDRVIDYAELKDKRLIPLLRAAKENFELALEADNSNTHARYWLSRLHLKYHVPGACKAIGAALLVEAADMGDPEAQYELGCRLRVENEYVQSDQQAFYYLEKAVDQLHPGALYLLGAVYLTGDCVKKDIASALWCFHRASEKGHAGAAIAYGSLLLQGAQVPECLTKLSAKRSSSIRKSKRSVASVVHNPVEMAREQFEIAARAGCDLGFKWLQRLEEEEKRFLAENDEKTETAHNVHIA